MNRRWWLPFAMWLLAVSAVIGALVAIRRQSERASDEAAGRSAEIAAGALAAAAGPHLETVDLGRLEALTREFSRAPGVAQATVTDLGGRVLARSGELDETSVVVSRLARRGDVAVGAATVGLRRDRSAVWRPLGDPNLLAAGALAVLATLLAVASTRGPDRRGLNRLPPGGAPGLEVPADVGAAAGQLDGLVGSVRQASRALEQVALPVQELVIVASPLGRIMTANFATTLLLGYGPEELVGENLTQLMDPGTAALLGPAALLARGGAPTTAGTLVRRDGSRVAVTASASVVRDPRGEIQGVILLAHDVTELRTSEARLRETEERLLLVVRNAPIVAFTFGADDRLSFVEGKGLDRLGLGGPAELVGRSVDELPLSGLAEGLRRARAGQSFRLPLERDLVAFDTWFAPIRGSDEVSGVMGIAADVSELRHAIRDAEEANRAKSQFLAKMSHELRTPLNSIIGFANILLKPSSAALPRDRWLVYLDRIQSNGRHLLGLINDVLDLSKVEAGRMDVSLGAVALGPLIVDVVAQFESQLGARGLTLTTAIPPDLEPVTTDATKFRQALINLIGNAIKFTERGGLTVRIETAADAPKHPCRLLIRDSGIGIPADRLAAVFEPFQQASATTAAQYGGTGLGLAITRAMLELAGHSIRVESEPGVGSTFIIEL